MELILFLLLLTCIISNDASSFDVILNVDGNKNYFHFIEDALSAENRLLPSIIILDDDHHPTAINSSSLPSIQTYHVESDDGIFSIATLINCTSSNSDLLFAVIQISNGSVYEIIPSLSVKQTRLKRSFNDDYIVKHKGTIVEQAYVSVEWHGNRARRSAKKPKKIPKKSRHIYLEITAIIDSLILNDVRTLLNKTEFETIEILKLYYIHMFIGVEQLYRQSLIHETLDIHIRLSKIIFSTAKHRLPWESFKNISSLTKNYRKSPNDLHLRPNISMTLLKSLHQAYQSHKFDSTTDHIMTFTRLDLIDGAGSAFVSGVCLPLYKYSIIQEDLNSYSMMITVTHELGHNLGLNHDEIENECNDPQIRYIMSPKNMHTVARRQVPHFSKCSIRQLNRFADKTTTKCWKNKIVSTPHDTKLNKLGQMINLRQQCQTQYGLRAIPFISVTYNKSQILYDENICTQLKCFKKPSDNFLYWQDGAFDGTPCGENRICHQKKCVTTKEKIKRSHLALCPYGDLFVPISMLNVKNKMLRGNMLCPDALNLLRARGTNVTYLCYNSILPYGRLCCEECKKHSIPECGDLHPKCSTFAQYCQKKFLRVDGRLVTELCPYTCGKCPHLFSTPISTKTTTVQTFTKKVKTTTPKPRKYIKPKKFTQLTCIDMADCSQLIKLYSKSNKDVKNWCTEYSTMIKDRYFVEMCPKYCSLCNITSECDRYKLCRNNGRCIKDEHGTYQCICSVSKSSYGTLCEYRRTCLNKPCSSKEYCIQTHGEHYVCLSKEDKEQMRLILNSTSKHSRKVL